MKAHLPRTSPFLLCLFGLFACKSQSQVADFAQNDLFYADVPFQTKAPGDRAVFVTPIRDARDGVALPTHERGFPITYKADDFWERPVPEMVAEVLQRQLAASQLFAAVADRASPQGLVMMPSLVTFVGGSSEAISGCRSFAEVGLRLQVYGPVGADGKRTLLHDQLYTGKQVSAQQLQPVSPYLLVCRVLQQTMTKVLSGLDGSNIARSDVPIDIAEPAEASAGAR